MYHVELIEGIWWVVDAAAFKVRACESQQEAKQIVAQEHARIACALGWWR
jgi:hypothetical protein